MEEYAKEMQKLARLLARVLVTNLGHKRGVLDDICDESTCFLRLNRYPVCPIAPELFGLVPHTDSDFLTILHQDEVGGLQLMKDSKWVAVKPNQDALIVNIGDLFQVISSLLHYTYKLLVFHEESREDQVLVQLVLILSKRTRCNVIGVNNRKCEYSKAKSVDIVKEPNRAKKQKGGGENM